MQTEPGGYTGPNWVHPYGCAAVLSRFDRRSALPGVKAVTYRTKGLNFEHEKTESYKQP